MKFTKTLKSTKGAKLTSLESNWRCVPSLLGQLIHVRCDNVLVAIAYVSPALVVDDDPLSREFLATALMLFILVLLAWRAFGVCVVDIGVRLRGGVHVIFCPIMDSPRRGLSVRN